MDPRDAQARDRSLLEGLGFYFLFWIGWVVLPATIGGVTRGGALWISASALLYLVVAHVGRFMLKAGRTAKWGPLAGLGPADVREVTHAVRKGEAVSEARLAAPAAVFAGQLRRWQSVSRILLPMIVVLGVIDLAVTPPHGTARIAQAAVKLAGLAVLAVLVFVGHRRATASEERNARLVSPS